jgi:putative PIN family toxin of toxin-antitoxin system
VKVVIDTNVLVSAALKDRGPEKVILFVVAQPDVEWVVTPAIMKEYREVLGRKKLGLPASILERWIALLDVATLPIEPAGATAELPRDPTDTPFLECALAADADFLITGDRDFEGAQKLGNTKIVSVALFLKYFFSSEVE